MIGSTIPAEVVRDELEPRRRRQPDVVVHPHAVRVKLGLAKKNGRLRRGVRVETARRIAATLVVLARTPYDVSMLARALADAEARTSVRLVDELPTWR